MFDSIWEGTAYVALVVLAIAGILFTVMPHNVTGYYLWAQDASGRSPLFCVYADMQWGPDFGSYCSTDIQQTGLVYQNLQRSLAPTFPTQ